MFDLIFKELKAPFGNLVPLVLAFFAGASVLFSLGLAYIPARAHDLDIVRGRVLTLEAKDTTRDLQQRVDVAKQATAFEKIRTQQAVTSVEVTNIKEDTQRILEILRER